MPAAPYRTPPAVKDPRTTRQLLKAIWFMLLATLLLVWFCLRIIDANESPQPHPKALAPLFIVLGLSVAMVVLAMICRQMIFNRARPRPAGPVKPQRYFVGSVVGMALCEAPVMISLMVGYLFDALTLFGVPAAVGLLGLLTMYPSGKPMEAVERGPGDPGEHREPVT